jgi:GABA permease
MAFSLGERGDAPKAFARTTSRGVPLAAIVASVVFGFVAVFFNYKFPDSVFLFLVNSSGAVALFVWLVICFSQLRMRKIIQAEAPEKLVVKMWLYPYLTWATAALIVFILGYMLTDTEHDGRRTVLLSLLVAAVVLAVAVVKERVLRGRVATAGPAGSTGPAESGPSESADKVSTG